MPSDSSMNLRLFIGVCVVGLFGIITFALAAATLGTLNKRLNTLEGKLSFPTNMPDSSSTQSTTPSATTTTTVSGQTTTLVQESTTSSTQQSTSTATIQPLINSTLATSINITEVLGHLKSLETIANNSNGTRAINTVGFNQTLSFIIEHLRDNTNFIVNTNFFSVRDFALEGEPILIANIDDEQKNYTYSMNLTTADFVHVKYGTSSDVSNAFQLTIIPNGGCTEADWRNAMGDTAGRVALIKRGGSCSFSDRAAQAPPFDVAGLLFYADGTSNSSLTPLEVSLGQNNQLPALFLSYSAGQKLADAVLNTSLNVTVQLGITLKDLPNFPVGNICADTPSGNVTQTIVIGSHSDSVPAGPGINDNGSGSAANLGLAIALARLFQTSTYDKYKYRVRFCWWGAEEVGLLGSKDHVKQAYVSTVPGERLSDYLINLNYDMLGSSNYIFGIYDGDTAKDSTPNQAKTASKRVTALYRQWFDEQSLPWNYTDFSGRSDYGPFLEQGIAAGGLFSGADGVKTKAEYDNLEQKLGAGKGGSVGESHDPCYHKECDTFAKIDQFAYEKMVRAAADILSHLARKDDLKAWLYA